MRETTKKFWLMKSEPDVFSIGDLKAKTHSRWDGVRNYMARNYMMRDMQIDDLVLFYHSNAKPSGVAGLARVSALAEPDATAFDKKSEYYDEKSTPEKPRWFCVEVEYVDTFAHVVTLEDIKKASALKHSPLKQMILLQNSRLSVQPVTETEFSVICKMAKHPAFAEAVV